MRVWLPRSEPRCRPGCGIREQCGRYLAEIPYQYAELVNYARDLGSDSGGCIHHLLPSECVQPAPVRRVHPPADGLV